MRIQRDIPDEIDLQIMALAYKDNSIRDIARLIDRSAPTVFQRMEDLAENEPPLMTKPPKPGAAKARKPTPLGLELIQRAGYLAKEEQQLDEPKGPEPPAGAGGTDTDGDEQRPGVRPVEPKPLGAGSEPDEKGPGDPAPEGEGEPRGPEEEAGSPEAPDRDLPGPVKPPADGGDQPGPAEPPKGEG